MLDHAYGGYMKHAFPADELLPVSCQGAQTLGGYSLTLIDALGTLAVYGRKAEFHQAVQLVLNHVSFDLDVSASVFETNIRVVGGLLSAHLLLVTGAIAPIDGYTDGLLQLAVDLADRLLPAFDTATGIPYGTVNLHSGVPRDEVNITCVAAGGSFAIEFGVLSRLTSDWRYEQAALRAAESLWQRRSRLDLVGNHLNIQTGEWTFDAAGVGTGADSYYEYLLKAGLLFNDARYLSMFNQHYAALNRHVKSNGWFLDVNMNNGQPYHSAPMHSSLSSFWPGLQVLLGDVTEAAQSMRLFFGVWRRYGLIPELYSVHQQSVPPNWFHYPLRPELAESLYLLYSATRDPIWRRAGRDMIVAIQHSARTPCGYATYTGLEHEQHDKMDSYFLAETLKYLYLLFDDANPFANDRYIFTTEGHLIPILRSFQQSRLPRDTDSPLTTNDVCDQFQQNPVLHFWQRLSRANFNPLARYT